MRKLLKLGCFGCFDFNSLENKNVYLKLQIENQFNSMYLVK